MVISSDAHTYPAWAHTTGEVLNHHQSDALSGLSDAQVDAQRIKYGYNELEKEPGTPLWKLVLAQFDDMLVKVVSRPFVGFVCFYYIIRDDAESKLTASATTVPFDSSGLIDASYVVSANTPPVSNQHYFVVYNAGVVPGSLPRLMVVWLLRRFYWWLR